MNAVVLHEGPLVRQDSIAPSKLQVRVQSVSYLADDINAFEFVSVDSDTLPAFTRVRILTFIYPTARFASIRCAIHPQSVIVM